MLNNLDETLDLLPFTGTGGRSMWQRPHLCSTCAPPVWFCNVVINRPISQGRHVLGLLIYLGKSSILYLFPNSAGLMLVLVFVRICSLLLRSHTVQGYFERPDKRFHLHPVLVCTLLSGHLLHIWISKRSISMCPLSLQLWPVGRQFLLLRAMTHIDNVKIIILLPGNDPKKIARHVDQDLFVEMFVTGLFLEKAFDFHKVCTKMFANLQIYKSHDSL